MVLRVAGPRPLRRGNLGNFPSLRCVEVSGSHVNDDCRLIEATLAGDTQAFGELVCRYQDRLYGALFYITGCPAQAQDIAQETFLLAFRGLSSFQGRSAFYSWLYRIALNQWASQRRRRRPRSAVEHGGSNGPLEPADPHGPPDLQLERTEQVELVRKAIAALNPEHRAILVLRELDGCDYDQIAETLQIPVGTVRSRLHRARLQLRQQLKERMPQAIG